MLSRDMLPFDEVSLRSIRPLHGLVSLLALAAAPAFAASLHQFEGLALSPAGDRIVTAEFDQQADAMSDPRGVPTIRSAQDGRVLATLDPCKTCGYSGFVYAPDGRLAFVARDRKAGVSRLMIADGRAARVVTSVTGLAARPRWSPDGRSLALLVTIGARKEAGATQAGAREVGEIGESYDEQRLAVVPAAGGAIRLVSAADRYVYEYDWTPDGRGFVATTAKGNGDANWWVATLDAIDLASGAERTIADPGIQMNMPKVSPDGRTVAFIGGLMSDFGSIGGDVWTVPLAGGTATDATPGYRGSFTSLSWDRAGLRGTALIGDRTAIVAVDPTRGAGAPLWSAPVSASAGDGRVALQGAQVAMVAQDFSYAPAIFAGPIAAPQQITHANDGYAPIAQARSLTWRSGGHDVQGWLVSPTGPTPTAKVPMITIVHGGPAAANTPGFLWQGAAADLLRKGYWLFFPNPRGSYGQGEAFTAANKRDFGGGDLKDILAGIDAAEAAAPIDENRLGLTGGSYGGFMAMWANTQTHRFKGIVAQAGLSDWISYYGTNGINTWMIPYFGKSMYEDQAAYWDVSAIKYIGQAKTPTLILVGERDIEVPPTQSVEYWNGLKAAGVPTSLVIYPDEGHAIRAPDHAADVRRRIVAWFDRTLSPKP